MKRNVSKLVESFWRQALLYAVFIVVIGGLLFFRLGTLVPGFSTPELLARADANSLHKIIANPLFLPHKLLQYGLIRLGHNGAFWMRSVSALFGLVVLVIFYDIIKSWYSRRIAIMSGFLLASSAWFLHFARVATPDVMLMGSIGLVWIGMKLRSKTAPRIRTILSSIVIILTCLYVPGLAWLIIPMLFWQRKLIWNEYSRIPKVLAGFVGVGIAIAVAPLAYGLARTPSLARSWLYLPEKIDPRLWLSNLWHVPVWLTLRGPAAPVYWLGHVPLLDVFSIAMLVLGLFVLNYFRLLDRVRALVIIMIFSCALAVFNGWIPLLIGLPMLFIVIAAGVALFLQQWFTVFPRNPLARLVGVCLVGFVILLVGYYNVHAYFVAWPRTPVTKQVFSKPS